MGEIWLIRHGVTAANRRGIIQGHSDEPLDALGRDQASRLARYLGRLELTFDRLIASPLARAYQTAEAIAAAVGAEIETEPGFAERGFGESEGQPIGPVYAANAAAADPSHWAPPGGESLADLEARVSRCLDRLIEHDHPRVAVVTHGGPIGAIVCRVLRMPFGAASLIRFRRDNTGITVLWSVRGLLTVERLNSRPHL